MAVVLRMAEIDPDGVERPVGGELAAVLGNTIGRMEEALNWVAAEAGGLDHGVRESHLQVRGREMMRGLLQDSLDLDALREAREQAVTSVAGLVHGTVERGHDRGLTTVFGDVRVTRLAYRHRKEANLYLADARLRLYPDVYSLGIRAMAARLVAGGSYEAAQAEIAAVTGVTVGRRQLTELAEDLADGVGAFYEARKPGVPAPASDALLLQADGKGIDMLPKDRKNGGRTDATHPGIKRLAEIVAVADLTPSPRKADDIVCPPAVRAKAAPGPTARGKWVAAGISCDIPDMISAAFDEADRRDPAGARQRVFLVDGNKTQIKAIKAEAVARDQKVPILLDFLHVAGYVRSAATAFYPQDSRTAQAWADGQLLRLLHGRGKGVAATMKAKATGVKQAECADIDACITYLTNNATHLDYATALERGWPIATGLIEGACRHVVADRMDITGARWSLTGAETILQLRALVINGDLDEYLTWYQERQFEQIHEARYAPSSRQHLSLAA
jgi:hypothetical protein